MEAKHGLQSALTHLKEAGGEPGSELNIQYRTTLATLWRIKRQERVPPSGGTKLLSYDKLDEGRLPDSRGSKIDREHPPAFPYGCDKHCGTCFEQFFPARIAVTDDEVLSATQALTKSIFADLDFLRSAIAQHADFIVSWWKKKSKAKRADFLSSLYPEKPKRDLKTGAMESSVAGLHDKKWAAIHLINSRSDDATAGVDPYQFFPGASKEAAVQRALTPHVLGFLKGLSLQEQSASHQTTWMLPYLDIETLADDPLLLLSLLYNRTQYEPVS